MRVQCPQCQSGGNLPDDKIPAGGTKIVCPKCKTSFFVQKPQPKSAPIQTAPPKPDADAYYKEGMLLLKNRELDAAIEKLNAAVQFNPQSGDAFRALGLAYGQKNLWAEASNVLQKAVSFTPNDTTALKNLGIAYLQMKQFDQAEATLQQAIKYAPNDEKLASFLAMAAKGKQQQTPKASSSGEPADAPAPPPQTPPVKRNPVRDLLDQGVELLDNGQLNKAIEAFQEVTRIAPNSSDGYVGLAMVYEKKEEWSKVVESYEKAVEANPNDTVAKETLRALKKQKKGRR